MFSFKKIGRLCGWFVDIITILCISTVIQGNFGYIAFSYMVGSGLYMGWTHQIHKLQSSGVIWRL